MASALNAEDTGLVTRFKTLSMNKRRENLIKLLLFLASLARFICKHKRLFRDLLMIILAIFFSQVTFLEGFVQITYIVPFGCLVVDSIV